MRTPIFILLVLLASSVSASWDDAWKAFAALPIQDEGRIKPMDTWARSTLLQLSAKSRLREEDGSKTKALEWMAENLFSPETAERKRSIQIHHPDLITALGLEKDPRNLYTYAMLKSKYAELRKVAEAASKIDNKERDPLEKESLSLYNKFEIQAAITSALSFSFEHPDFTLYDKSTARLLGQDSKITQLSFLQVHVAMPVITAAVDSLTKMGILEKPKDSLSASVKNLLELRSNHDSWLNYYRNSHIAIIPHPDKKSSWVSPWTLLSFSPAGQIPLPVKSLADVANAYRKGDAENFRKGIEDFETQILPSAAPGTTDSFGYELLYNNLDPFYLSKILFGLGLLVWFFSQLLLKRHLARAAWILLALGLLPGAVGVVLRMLVTGRPPVTNLFETFIFTGLTAAALGLILEKFNGKGLGTFVGCLGGLGLMLVSGKYSSEGDTMQVLVAVLDSNFWLTTHVITISLGYAGCVVAGIIGHFYLIQAVRQSTTKQDLNSTYKMIFATLAFGLFFSFVGTVLGGIWADQSWGRFWGWDPKENGALLIVLWTAMLLHLRPAKLTGPTNIAAGSILGIIVVMLAWFGVNLLGVGLHSYGFTSGIANALGIYIGLEVLFLVAVLPRCYLMDKMRLEKRN